MRIHLFILLLVLSMHSFAQEKIHGVIQDEIYRHTLAGANVFFTKDKSGTTTDRFGRFTIAVSPVDDDTLVIAYIGYTTKKIPITRLSFGQKINYLELQRTILVLDELRVEADRYKEESRSLRLEPGSARLNFEEIRTVPYTAYPDINRSLQFLPGVISTNDLTSELNIRGGSPDQNLVLLEGVPVYYPFHVFGIASAFNADMIGEVHFSPGGFSAKYGDRLSSVLNVRAHSPQKPLEMSANLSVIGMDFTASGRLRQKLEWVGSARKSYYDLLLKNMGSGVPYAFYDLFSKVNFTPNASNTFSIMYFSFRDRFSEEQTDEPWLYFSPDAGNDHIIYQWFYKSSFSWSNRVLSFAWDRRLLQNITLRLQAYQSSSGNRFHTDNKSVFPKDAPEKYKPLIDEILEQDKLDRVKVDNGLTDRNGQVSLDWKISQQLTFFAGAQRSIFKTDYGWGNNSLPFTPLYNYQDHIRLYFDHAPPQFDYRQKFNLTSAYGELLWDTPSRYQLRAGLRATKWNTQNKTFLEPRLNLSYNISENVTGKMAFGYFTQGLATSLEEGFVGFLRLYFPLEDSLGLEQAKHYILNLSYDPGENRQVSLTTYLKDFGGLAKSVGPGPDFIPLSGKAYGIEFFAKARFFGWKSCLAATISRTFRVIDGLKYDTNWDQRYGIDLYAAKNIGKNWTFSWAWTAYSGVPYIDDHYVAAVRDVNWNKPLDNQQDRYKLVYIDVPPGRIRYPWYHRLDVSLEKEFHFSTWHLNVYFSIRNLYARKNVLYFTESSSLSYDTKNGRYVDYFVRHPRTWLPPIPTIGLRIVR